MNGELESEINELLLRNGWDYDDRKRVLFMLKNHKLCERMLDECIDAVYKRYGNNLTAFFDKIFTLIVGGILALISFLAGLLFSRL